MSYAALEIVRMLVAKSGVRDWQDEGMRSAIIAAANEIALGICETDMATSKMLIAEMDGTPKQIVFADHAGDFNPAAANDLRDTTSGNRTNVQNALAGVANAAYWQSAKFDFGVVRAQQYDIRGALKNVATPSAGNAIDMWLSPSHHATAANANTGGASGSSAAYTGYSSNAAAASKQLIWIGCFIATTQTTVQVLAGGRFSPTARYGSLILLNGFNSAFYTDDIEIHVVFDPVVPQAQAA